MREEAPVCPEYGRERRKPNRGSEPPGNLEYCGVGRSVQRGETGVGKLGPEAGGGRSSPAPQDDREWGARGEGVGATLRDRVREPSC